MIRASQITSEETLPGLVANLADSIESLEHIESNVGGGGSSSVADWQRRRRSVPGSMVSTAESLTRTASAASTSGYIPPPYPVAVVFVLIAKLFEAFAANGIRTILVLYLRDDLNFNENLAIICLHGFNFFGQFCPIFGAVLADSYIGNVRTIQLFYYLYGFGWLILMIAILPVFHLSMSFLVVGSLLFIAIGNGSSRACVTSLGAQQFCLPVQGKQLAGYFSLYYLVYYAGILLSKVLPPLIRVRVHCFNRDNCYPAVFGVLATSFFTAWFTFSVGKFFYKPEELIEENVLLKFYGCIKCALWRKWTTSRENPSSSSTGLRKPVPVINRSWLEYAIDPYDREFVDKVQQVLKLMVLFLPLPFYFAILTQQDSSWTFQASQMDTRIYRNVHIQPDQVKALGPIFLFLLIPLWQYIVHPLLRQSCHYELKPLQSVALGGICAALSFFCAGLLERPIQMKSPRSISVMWQIPQFLLIMLGELFLSIPGLQFAYTQAPSSMKSVVTAAWFLNNAFGNLIVILCTELKLFDSQMAEFYFFAIIMLISIMFYMWLAYNYLKRQPFTQLNHHHHHHHPYHHHHHQYRDQDCPCYPYDDNDDDNHEDADEQTPLIQKTPKDDKNYQKREEERQDDDSIKIYRSECSHLGKKYNSNNNNYYNYCQNNLQQDGINCVQQKGGNYREKEEEEEKDHCCCNYPDEKEGNIEDYNYDYNYPRKDYNDRSNNLESNFHSYDRINEMEQCPRNDLDHINWNYRISWNPRNINDNAINDKQSNRKGLNHYKNISLENNSSIEESLQTSRNEFHSSEKKETNSSFSFSKNNSFSYSNNNSFPFSNNQRHNIQNNNQDHEKASTSKIFY